MIAPLAITLALAFLQPYSTQPLCPNGVQIVYDQPSPQADTGWVEPQDMAARDCRFHVRADIAGQRVEYQCMVVAHELGHAALGLPDTTDMSLMDVRSFAHIPGACYPPSELPSPSHALPCRAQPRHASPCRAAPRPYQRIIQARRQAAQSDRSLAVWHRR